MSRLSYRDAVSRAIARAVDVYYQSAPGGMEAELVERVFQEYLNHFRRMLWGSENVKDFLVAVEGTIGPLSDWVGKDLLQP
ncbi:hypothetical protein G7K71_13590 [Desulfofundulus sp. TPOSR]|uniref:hypothetical protein n=1 Tax=Desulfofundulus sp. TPOSR TaxID=2714340 RepID=UPI00140D8988|nr:hypothetical protein [Desulfofundulus sp. TPOSR]NHM27991.1 hypothetical protein [Desulfofundulus sp. TPOSR]